jgi:hypothetical protein
MDNGTWSTVGKVAVGASLLTGLVFGIRAGYNQIWSHGAEYAATKAVVDWREKEEGLESKFREEKANLVESHKEKLNDLKEEGFLLPENRCLRYSGNENNNNSRIFGVGDCKDLDFTVNYDGGVNTGTGITGAILTFKNHQVNLGKNYRGEVTIEIKKKVAESWENLE